MSTTLYPATEPNPNDPYRDGWEEIIDRINDVHPQLGTLWGIERKHYVDKLGRHIRTEARTKVFLDQVSPLDFIRFRGFAHSRSILGGYFWKRIMDTLMFGGRNPEDALYEILKDVLPRLALPEELEETGETLLI